MSGEVGQFTVTQSALVVIFLAKNHMLHWKTSTKYFYTFRLPGLVDFFDTLVDWVTRQELLV